MKEGQRADQSGERPNRYPQAALLISDLHLDPGDHAGIDRFLRLLSGPLRSGSQLLIVGDLFEVWIGDDDDGAWIAPICRALRACADAGVRVGLMRGNRDLLIGDHFARASGITLLDDPTTVELGGITTLLSHGDRWCSDDHAYQAVRRQLHDPAWQHSFLQRPLTERRQLARAMRQQSIEYQQSITRGDSDPVNQQLVVAECNATGARRVIHGHTHHHAHLTAPDSPIERHVLAAWEHRGHALSIGQDGRWSDHWFD